MSRYFTGLLTILSLCIIALAGCGGGGSSSSGGSVTPPPSTGSDRVLTGKIVSSNGGAGVSNVAVTLGIYTAITGTDGTFSIGPLAGSADIPATFTVDAGGAGTGYLKDDIVTYNSQQYWFNAIDIPVDVRNGLTNSLGTITVRYSADGTPSIPWPDKDTVLAGRVVKKSDPTQGIPNVTVRFGVTSTFVATTGAKGYFALNLGRRVDPISLFPAERYFSIDTSTATGYPNSLTVTYLGTPGQLQSRLPVPGDVVSGDSTDLGTIIVGTAPSGGGDGVPDPPPFF